MKFNFSSFKINIGYIVITFVIIILVVLWYKKIESIESSIFNLKNNDKSILNRLVDLELLCKNKDSLNCNEESNQEELNEKELNEEVCEDNNEESSDEESEVKIQELVDEQVYREVNDSMMMDNNITEISEADLENLESSENTQNTQNADNLDNIEVMEEKQEEDNNIEKSNENDSDGEEASLLQQYINEENNETDISSVKSEEIVNTKPKVSAKRGRGRKKNN